MNAPLKGGAFFYGAGLFTDAPAFLCYNIPMEKITHTEPDIKRLSRELKYENKWMKVYEDKIERRNGEKGIYGVVEKADFSLIIPVDGDFVYLVEQFRYPLGVRSLEFPQGGMEAEDVDAAEGARRELREETGLAAEKIEKIGEIYVAVGFSNQRGHVFVATGLSQGKAAPDAEEEDLVCTRIPIAELKRLIKENVIKDSGSLGAWALYEGWKAGKGETAR